MVDVVVIVEQIQPKMNVYAIIKIVPTFNYVHEKYWKNFIEQIFSPTIYMILFYIL